MILSEHIKAVLLSRPSPFISLSTTDSQSRPNAGLKFLLKVTAEDVYFIDVPFGQTYLNLKHNGKVCFSFYDQDSLKCYKIYGHAQLINQKDAGEELRKEVDARIKDVIVSRIIEGVHRGRPHKAFLTDFPQSFLVIKVKAERVFEYGIYDPQGRPVL